MCPFLVPVVADRLWLYPTGVYCRRPGRPVRVPAGATLGGVCATAAYQTCPCYRESVAQEREALGLTSLSG